MSALARPVGDDAVPVGAGPGGYLLDVVCELARRDLLVDGAILHGEESAVVLFDVPAAPAAPAVPAVPALQVTAGPLRIPVSASWSARHGWSVCTACVGGPALRRRTRLTGGPTPSAGEVADFVVRATDDRLG
ncbi:hypothetical protein [Pseudonocardia sp. H11422]|uniref:hypothetical protein n=1 Tax=Pseudonocardia sp. H11422 TaxID=2835866 RepID=UPI001BDDA14F|nr:hypothetical protein [Pseudonocardia sp. H11422]